MDSTPQYDRGDIAWVLASTAFVWLMIPGCGYFYSGCARAAKNALAMIMSSVLCIVVVSIQWYIWGYSLCFSKTASFFIGNMDNAFLRNVLSAPSVSNPAVPDLIFMIFQCQFAALTPSLAIGSAADRVRLFPLVVFVFLWSTLVYDFIACWTWNPHGWSATIGVLDFAGGTPVHITSGFASLAYALIIGRGAKSSHTRDYKPYSMPNVILGTCFLWFGWFGFNGGSALNGTMRAGMAVVVTNLSAAVAAVTWMGLDYLKFRRFSALSFCSGAVAGLVAITPAAGYVGISPSVAIGFLGGAACNGAAHFKNWLNFDDVADVFAIHGVGGLVGSLLTGVFAEQYIAALDGDVIQGGWMNGNWMQVPRQLADCAAGAGWSFCVTYLILLVMDRIPGLSLRVPREELIRQHADDTKTAISAYSQSKGRVTYYHVDRIISIDPETGEQHIVHDEFIESQSSPRQTLLSASSPAPTSPLPVPYETYKMSNMPSY
ncbi:ammonium transporter AmtB-like domain-containing protein [Gongronella butleri]|nr:ammonium transporter AmtB-like domain-containing protein [Gongronella butleri]